MVKTYYGGELYHHGVLGQKWGKRNGPPYPLKPNQHSSSEKKAGWSNSLEPKSNASTKTSVDVSKQSRDSAKTTTKKDLHAKRYNRTVYDKKGTKIDIRQDDDSRFAKFLQRHSKRAREEAKKSMNAGIFDGNKRIGDLDLYDEGNGSLNVVWIGINEKYRGSGKASAVMKDIIANAKENGYKQVTLEVPGSSPDARHIYEKIGFKEQYVMTNPEDDVAWGGLTKMKLDLTDELKHHDILNQKWGVRNGPPYPLSGGDYSPSEVKAIYKKRRVGNSIYNKRHFDDVLRANKTVLSTLSYNKDRTKNVDMFYATHKALDKHQYNALFNSPVKMPMYDDNGNEIGTGQCLKYRIDNKVRHDVKIASEDSGAKIFMDLYKKDRDFYNFVNDKDRMQSYFVADKYKFKGYREARDVLNKMKNPTYKPTAKEMQVVYRMFNYVIPYDGAGNTRKGNDMAKQRAKFFTECKKAGYGAVLDTNDAIYGGFKATSPVIVFDMEEVVPKDIYQTKMSDKAFSSMVLAGRKFLGV